MKTHVIKFVDGNHGRQGYVSLDGRKYQPTHKQFDRLMCAMSTGTRILRSETKHTRAWEWRWEPE
jgi:hypothetical protein